MPRQQRSAVWNYFDEIPGDPYKAKCRLCRLMIQHGSYTSNMFSHLRRKHPESYKEAEDQQEEMNAMPCMKPKSKVEKSMDSPVRTARRGGRGRGAHRGRGRGRPRKYPQPASIVSQRDVAKSESRLALESDVTPNTSSAAALSLMAQKNKNLEAVNSAILHWLAADMLHLSVLSGDGFKNFLAMSGLRSDLHTKTSISDTAIPKLAEKAKAKVKSQLEADTSVAITLESWTYRQTQNFVTVTAHFIRDGWGLSSCVLETFESTLDKAESNLATSLKRVLDQWELTKNVFVAMTDVQEEVMSSAVAVCGWEELSCFGRVLNMCVSGALQSVPEVVSVHKKLTVTTTYFYDKVKVAEALRAVQEQHGLPVNRLRKELPNLWTSTYAAMERMVEQFEAVNTVLCFLGQNQMCLCDDEVEIVKTILQVLKPFHAVVEELSTQAYTCVSKLIPVASLLQQVLTYNLAEVQGHSETYIALTNALLSQVQENFSGLESNSLLAAATLLDPRFKQHAFTDSAALNAAQEQLLLATQEVVRTSDSSANQVFSAPSSNSASLWDIFDQKVVEAKAVKTDVSEAENETSRFFKEANIPRTADPLQWWRVNEGQFPYLKVLARKYLCIPATALDCERLFTKENQNFARNRDSFQPSELNTMIFLNQNLL